MTVPVTAAPIIALEGIDGSGKGTQAQLLRDALIAQGSKATLISFPRYTDTFFGARIGEFLNGKFGALEDLDPFLISLLYAGDRLESRDTLLNAAAESDIVILDRYVASNVAHQSAKRTGNERRQLQEWIEHIEFEIHGLPRPTLTLLLDLPVDISQELIQQKSQRAYTDRKTDLQEADVSYMQSVREAYLDLAERSSGWQTISVLDGTNLRSRDDIASEIAAHVATSGRGMERAQ